AGQRLHRGAADVSAVGAAVVTVGERPDRAGLGGAAPVVAPGVGDPVVVGERHVGDVVVVARVDPTEEEVGGVGGGAGAVVDLQVAALGQPRVVRGVAEADRREERAV